MSKKEVMEHEEAKLPVVMDDLAADVDGGGFEDADKDSFAIPILRVLQKMSPQVDEEAGEYIEGAKAGMLIDTSTGELYDVKNAAAQVVPVHFKRSFIEWKKREDNGGGFVAEYDVATGLEMMKTTTKDDKNRDILPNGHELQDTRTHYLLLIDSEGSPRPCLFPVVRTQVKGSKDWMNRMRVARLPNGRPAAMFAQRYGITTITRTKDQNTWYVFKAVSEQDKRFIDSFPNSNEILEAAKGFRDMILAGSLVVDHNAGMDAEDAVGGSQTYDNNQFSDEDDIPGFGE